MFVVSLNFLYLNSFYFDFFIKFDSDPDMSMRRIKASALLLDHAAHQRAAPQIVVHPGHFQRMLGEDNVKIKN